MRWKDAVGIAGAAIAFTAMVLFGVPIILSGILALLLYGGIWWAWTYYLSHPEERKEEMADRTNREIQEIATILTTLNTLSATVGSERVRELIQRIGLNGHILKDQFAREPLSYMSERMSVCDRLKLARELVTQYGRLEQVSRGATEAARLEAQQGFSTIEAFLDQTAGLFESLLSQIQLGKVQEIASTISVMNEVGEISQTLLNQSR